MKLKINVVLALVTAAVLAASVPAQAEETSFTLEDAIRNQIFLELKSNVKSLYQNSGLLVPGVDTSLAARIASNNINNSFVLPVNTGGKVTEKNSTAEKIN